MRKLAEELTRKDSLIAAQGPFSDFGPLGEKDNLNTSASETSPSQLMEVAASQAKPKKLLGLENASQEDDDDIDEGLENLN